MSLQTFYSIQFEAAKELLDILDLQGKDRVKPLNVEDVDWQLSDEGPLDPFILTFNYGMNGVVKVYPKLYIGLAVDNDLSIMKLLYRYARTLGLTPLQYGRINLDMEGWIKYFDIVDLGLISVVDSSTEYYVKGLKFNILNGKVIVSKYLDSLGILLYLFRPLSAMMGCSPYLSLPVKIEHELELGDGFHLLDDLLKPASSIRNVYYGCVSVDDVCYLEDLRLITIPRYKT